jgi:prepilin-type N-terminal cleavage/methylation domain-containing protein
MRSNSRRLYRGAGFTLIEVVVAMAIVGLGVVALLEIFSLGLRLGARSSLETESMAYGRQVMDEVLARRKIEEGPVQGYFQGSGRWRLQIQNVHEPTRALSLGSDWELKEVSLDVRLMDGGREREVEFKTFRLARKSEP